MGGKKTDKRSSGKTHHQQKVKSKKKIGVRPVSLVGDLVETPTVVGKEMSVVGNPRLDNW